MLEVSKAWSSLQRIQWKCQKKGQWDAGLDSVANKESSDTNICNTFEKYILVFEYIISFYLKYRERTGCFF